MNTESVYWLPVLASFFSGIAGVLLGGKIAWHQFVASKTIDVHEKILVQAADTFARVRRVSSLGTGDSAASMQLLNKHPEWIADQIADASESCQTLSLLSEDSDICRLCDDLTEQLDTVARCHRVVVSLINASLESASSGESNHYGQSIYETSNNMRCAQSSLREHLDSLRRLVGAKFSIRQSLSKSAPFEL